MKNILITGAASGLGKAIAQLYAQNNWNVLVVDIQDDLGNAFVEELNNTGFSAQYYHCDIGRYENFEALFEQISSEHSSIDVLVNNAGIASAGVLEQTTVEEWQKLISLDLMSVIYGTKVFLPLLKKSKKAHIVSTASFAGLALMPGMMSYNVAKAGVIAFSETLQGEMEIYNIGVSVVCPAFFQTNLVSSMDGVSAKTTKFITNQMQTSGITAQNVAQDIFNAVEDNTFMIISHKQAKRQYLIKRLFPKMFMKKKNDVFKKINGAKS